MDTYANASGPLQKEYIRHFPERERQLPDALLVRRTSLQARLDGQQGFERLVLPGCSRLHRRGEDGLEGKYLKDAGVCCGYISWKNCLDVSDEGADAAEEVRLSLKSAHSASEANRAGTKTRTRAKISRWLKSPFPEDPEDDGRLRYVTSSTCRMRQNCRRSSTVARSIFFENNYFDKAIPLFRISPKTTPKSELALYSANLLLRCIAIKINSTKPKGRQVGRDDGKQVDKFRACRSSPGQGSLRSRSRRSEQPAAYQG